MKVLKRALVLALALIMSLSLFACKTDGDNDNELELKPIETPPEQVVDGNLVYETLTGRMTPVLSYNEENDYDAWKEQVRARFIKQLGIDKIEKNACPLNVTVEETKDFDTYTRYHILFDSEYGATVPCYLLIPKTGEAKYPLAITLQGHSSLGYHFSVGDSLGSEDPEVLDYIARGDFAVQAVERGYAALAIEQRGMSDRTAISSPEGASMCEFAAQQEMILGRTLIGGRVWDVSKAIDALSDNALSAISAKIDLSDITITGNSGGGTTSYYAACYDERITVSAPSCGFCNYEDSIMSVYHCSCNFIPGAYEYFDMQDLACLIAPRKLAIVTGAADQIFPLLGVDKAYETIEKIYQAAGVPENCDEVVTNKGHYWVESKVWEAIDQMRAL